jgi:hypothetical protein
MLLDWEEVTPSRKEKKTSVKDMMSRNRFLVAIGVCETVEVLEIVSGHDLLIADIGNPLAALLVHLDAEVFAALAHLRPGVPNETAVFLIFRERATYHEFFEFGFHVCHAE